MKNVYLNLQDEHYPILVPDLEYKHETIST